MQPKMRYLRKLSSLWSPSLELTLAILKPDVCANPKYVSEIKELILKNGFYFVRSKELILSKQDAEIFYTEHRGKFFFDRLVSFMTSGKVSAHILTCDGAIQKWRQLLGPTKVYKAQYEQPESIRGRYGLTDTRNAAHGSDSADSAIREIKIYFPEFKVDEWMKSEEIFFKKGQVDFDPKEYVHKIRSVQ